MKWQRLLILDLALLAAFVGAALRVQKSWKEFEASHRVELVKAESEPARTLPAATAISASAEDWTDIAARNPFSFDRNDVTIVAPKQTATAAAQPKPILFGTLSVGNDWIAMLAPSGSRASRPAKIGETFGEWKVVEISEKSVVVTGTAGARETILMNDPTAQVARQYDRTATNIASTTATNVFNSAAAPQAPAAAGNQTAPTAPASQPPSGQQQPRMLMTPFGPVPRTDP